MIYIINKYNIIFIFLFLSCNNPSPTDGDPNLVIPKTSFSISDFQSSEQCAECHPDQYNQWSRSMHSFTAFDPKFFNDWYNEQYKRPETGEDFCSQCHLPVGYLVDMPMGGHTTPDEFHRSDIPPQIKDAVSCSFCHSMVETSSSIHTDPMLSGNARAVAEYFLFPGENIQFGSIPDPEENNFHRSEFNPIYKESESCLPCHNHIIRNKLIETTFSEWNSNSFVGMTGEPSCQSCHMKEYIGQAATGSKERLIHNHNFVGVGLDLTRTINNDDQWFKDTSELLKTALSIEYLSDKSIFSASSSDSIDFLVSIKSKTAHSIPTGNAFVRQAWLEFVIYSGQDTIFTSGLINSNTDKLDSTTDLVVFSSELLDSEGRHTYSASDAYNYSSTQLLSYGEVVKEFRFPTSLIDSFSTITVSSRMLFRPYKPDVLELSHPDLLENMPVFEMFSITEDYIINELNYD